MSRLHFRELAAERPDDLSHSLRRRFRQRRKDPASVDIAPDAGFEPPVKIGRVKRIGARTIIRAGAVLEGDVSLGSNVTVGEGTLLAFAVRVGSTAMIGGWNYFARGAEIPGDYDDWDFQEDYKRTTHDHVIVGPGIILPSEVQLGLCAVIPTADSVGEIGRFGQYQRMVTAYGSEQGPKYSVGCQFGIDINTFKRRVTAEEDTVRSSAQDYARHMPEIEELGASVQAAFEREANLVNELTELHREMLQRPSNIRPAELL